MHRIKIYIRQDASGKADSRKKYLWQEANEIYNEYVTSKFTCQFGMAA